MTVRFDGDFECYQDVSSVSEFTAYNLLLECWRITMRFQAALLTVCALLFLTSIRGAAQSTTGTEKQIAQVMNTWVEDWNEKRIDDLTTLYYSHAVLLP